MIADSAAQDNLLDWLTESPGSPRAEVCDSTLRAYLRMKGVPQKDGISRQQIRRMIGEDIAEIDRLMSEQVNAILHHPRFQQIEATWRGLRLLVEAADQAENRERIRIRILNVSWDTLARDFAKALDFDGSTFFRKVYEEEFGSPGGEPYGVLLGDYYIGPQPQMIATLRSVAQVAATAFAPFVASVLPIMFGLEQFDELHRLMNLETHFRSMSLMDWRTFRDDPDARFVGLVLPRILVRTPYEDTASRVDGFRFREDVEGPGAGKYLWGNAVYALGTVLLRAFDQSGWLADTRGVQPGKERGGLVTALPTIYASTDRYGLVPRCSTEVMITDRQEFELTGHGFIPLCHVNGTEYSAFYSLQSTQSPQKFDDAGATASARLSSSLRYTLCVSRFAHYFKVIMRDKVGSFSSPEECQDYLQQWLNIYVTPDSEASFETKAQCPLRQAHVTVSENPRQPGSFLCTARLWPHYELDELKTSVRIERIELSTGRSR